MLVVGVVDAGIELVHGQGEVRLGYAFSYAPTSS